jgi:O-antigen/teichoic acid export membrane protein
MKLKSVETWLLQLKKYSRQKFEQLFQTEMVRRIVRNSGYLFSTTGISAAASMLQGILAARLLGAAGFGILGTITLFTSTINNFASFRMGELVVKYVGYFTEHEDRQSAAAIFKLAALFEMLASLVAFGLILLLAPLGAKYFVKDPGTAPLFTLYGLIVLANLIAESSTGLLQIFDRFRRLAGMNILQSMVTLLLITITFFSTGDPIGGLIGILIAYLVGKMIGAVAITAAALVEAKRRWGGGWWRTSLGLLRPRWRELAQFAISTNISATISLVTKDSELLWVSLLRSPVEAGYYKLALALANMVQMPIEPLPQATYPELSRQVARDQWANVRTILRQGSRLAGTYSVFMTLFLVLFGKFLIPSLYSSEFLPAYPALVILLAGLLVANIFYWRRVTLLALGRADFPAKVNFVLAVFKIVGIVLLVPQFGFLASAALLAGFYWIGSLISVLKIRSLITQREQATQARVTEAE